MFELKFSDNSYGFRPSRNTYQATKKARQYMDEGYIWVVDIDLEKYFDTVNHHKFISLIAREVKGKRVLKLIRAYLNSGVMINGVVAGTDKGLSARRTPLITGWVSYFRLADIKTKRQELDVWTRRRIRMCYWKQWKKIKARYDNLIKLGIDNFKAWEYANTRKGY